MMSGKTSNNMYYSEEALKAQDGILKHYLYGEGFMLNECLQELGLEDK